MPSCTRIRVVQALPMSTTRSTQIVTMGFPDRGEENLMRQTSRCKNFQPNMFNKTKCQNCFRTREAHDLGDDDGNNKPKKALQCGYLFVAPGIDFDNPMSRNRKWQRRCFILYENGELCYALDYDPNTIPQGVVNMYQCIKVFNADKLTGHSFSIGICTPDETTYVRAETREEKDGWYETLIEYPEINKEAERQKKKKRGVFPMLAKDSEQPQRIEDEQAEAKPDLPASSEDPLSEIESLEREDELGTDILLTTARDTTDIYTASSKAARKEKSNLRRSQSALEHRPEKYDKKQTVRRTPSAQTPLTSTETSSTPTKKDREERLNRRHTTTGRTDVKDALGSDGQEVTGKGDASRRPVSDGSSSKYSGSSGMRSRHSESGLAELEAELRNQADSGLKLHRESLPAQANIAEPSLHRNNNNVYKDVSPRLSPTQQATSSSSRKSSLSDRSISPTDSQTTTDSQTKKSQPSKADTNSQNLLSQEELQRLDVPKRGRLKLNKALIEGETQSPSKRTIERRRHAHERRNRHTLDGSTVPFPISERKTPEGGPRLKRSNSDPNLADNEEVKRKEIAETFPGLLHLKNGWLMKRDSDQEDWNKHWFVLRDNKLSHFKDSSDESPSNLAGAVDLARCREATETSASRNYGFQIKMEDDTVHHLGAMTSKIRTNWIQAINKAIATAQKEASPVVPEKEPINLDQIDAAPVTQEKTAPVSQEKPPVIPTTAPDVIPTPLPKQDSIDSSRSNLTIDLTSRHRKSSLDSRKSESASPTEREPAFQERQGSIRSKERRSRRSSRGDEFKLQKSSSRSSINGRSSSTSSEVFETPPNTPTPIELRIEEPARRTSTTSTRSERVFRAESPIQIQKIEADSLKSQPDQQQGDSIAIESLQQQQRKSFDVYQRQPSLDNENEQKALVSQLETVVKKLSQVELQNQTLHMEVKQARNANANVKHEKEELHDKLETAAGALDKRSKECETIQGRFEKLVSDYQESEKELSKARSSLKTERDKAVTMIERLNQQIEIVEGEKKEYRERAKKGESELSAENKTMRQLEKNQEESQEIIKKLLAKMEGYKQRIEAKGGDDTSATREYVQKLERHQQDLQGVNMQLQNRLQEVEKELETKSQAPHVRLDSESELETELADMRMELSERDEQIEQLSEQLETEFSEKSELQKKYDSVSAQMVLEGQGDKARSRSVGDVDLEDRLRETATHLESLKMQLNKEATLREQTEDKLSGEASVRQGLEASMQEMEKQLRIATEEKHHTSQVHEDTKNLMELLQGKNKEVEKMQIEMKRTDADRISLMEQTGRYQATMDALKQQLKESDESKTTLEGDFDCVLHSKVDLEESAKQLTAELVTIKSELELLRQASQSASSTEAEEEARKDAARKEVLLLQAQVGKVQAMYTEDMFKKEQLLAEKHESCSELERRLGNLQSKLTQKEEALAKSDRESGEKMLEMTQQVEQLGQKVDRGDRELKRVRQELKSSQDNYDALELKHMQNVEEAKQQQKSQQEQLELMGRRIQDLTSKLGLAERKVRDLTSVEAGWSSFGGGNGDISVSGVHVGAMSGNGLNTTHNLQSSGIHSQLMEVEQVLGSAESRSHRQHQKASALEGKIDSVEKRMEAIEQAGPSNSISSFDHDVSVNSSSSPSCNSSINQLSGATTTAAKTAETSDTSESSSDCPSSDGADGGSKIKILESRLAEMEQKLKKVTHRLVDVTTRELEKRKAYQAKCVTENRLKDQVRGLQREVLALRQQTEKVQSHSESSARHTHTLLAQCRQHLMRIQPAKPSQSLGDSSTDSPRVSKESTNTANTTDKTITAVPSSATSYHVTDACHTLDKALDLLISQLKSLEIRKRKSLTEFSESVILGLGDLSGISDGDRPKSPRSCPPSPLFFSTSPPLSPDMSSRGSKHLSKVSDKRYGQLFRFPAKANHGLGSQGFYSGKMQRIRYCHCLLEVEYLNSFLVEMSSGAMVEDDCTKLLSCHRMIEAEDRDGSIEIRLPGDKNVSGYAAGLSKSIIREAESEFMAMKEPVESYPVIGSNEISAVYTACTTFFTSNWEFSHSMEKDLEVKCDALAKILADETTAKKHESPAEATKGVLKPKESGYSNPQRIAGKNDSGLGLDSDLAPFAEGIAYEEALRVAMECVSSELVLAEALQSVNSTIEEFVGKIDSEEVKCKRALTLLRSVGIQRFSLIRDAIARQLEATSGLIRQKYWDYLQESEDEVESKMEESKKKKKKSKKESKDTLKNGTPKRSSEELEGATEKEIAVLVLMKAVLSGLVVHLRSELSMLADGNSNQNNDSSGGLSLDALGDVVLPSQVIDYKDHVTGTIKEDTEARRRGRVDEEGVVRARLSTLESITAEHSRNIAMVRERYEAIIKGERTVHEQELIQLRQRLVTADSAVKRLEEDITTMGERGGGTVSLVDLGSILIGGQVDLKEAHKQLNSMRADILGLVEYHKKKLGQMERGIQAITRCYQKETEDLYASYQDKLKELQNKGRQDLADAQHRYQEGISEMEQHHESQTKRLVKEAKEQINEEMLLAQQRSHSQMVEEMERSHRKELEERESERRQEKEKEDESVTTAISVLKKAYEEELEKEKRMSQESYPKDVETIMKRHREVVTQMNRDWVILSTKFSEQCKENSMLSKALRAMQRSQKEAHEKLQRAQVENRRRVTSLGEELARIEMEEDEDDEDEEEDAEKEKDVKVLEINLRLRELELDFAREEIESLRQAVEGDAAGGGASQRTTGQDIAGAGEKTRRSSFTSQPESDGATRPKNRRSLSDLTHMFHKSKKGEKK